MNWLLIHGFRFSTVAERQRRRPPLVENHSVRNLEVTCINTAKAGGTNWMGNANVDCIGTVGGQERHPPGAMASFSSPPVR